MMSSIGKSFLLFACLVLSGCASFGASNSCGGDPRPPWVDKTAIELNLPDTFHYGLGQGATYTEATNNALGDIAQQVSATIFSRTVSEQMTEGQRAAAIAQVLSQVQASGVEPLHKWQALDCMVYVQSRVLRSVAAKWKTAEQSFLTVRPGLGQVRRDRTEINAILYQEKNSPDMFMGWRSSIASSKPTRPLKLSGQQALVESEVRRILRTSQINIQGLRQEAKIFLVLFLGDGVIEGAIRNRQGVVLAQSAVPIDEPARVRGSATTLMENLLEGWLGGGSTDIYR